MAKHCALSVNINKLATLRNSRGGNNPNLTKCTIDIIRFGAEGITVHPRPDGRHIRSQDVIDISRLLAKINRSRKLSAKSKIEFNIEGYPNSEYLKLIDKVNPDQCTLVPDPPTALTSNAGWKMHKNKQFLIKIVRRLQKQGIRVSLFIDVFSWNKNEAIALLEIAPDRIELYTERFAKDFENRNRSKSFSKSLERTLKKYSDVARWATNQGIHVNAGHDLDSKNVGLLIQIIPQIVECSIGHALICESLYEGLETTIKTYRKALTR